jgi:hypothetical protein
VPVPTREPIRRKYGYPPRKQEKATLTVLEQAEVLSANWRRHEAPPWGAFVFAMDLSSPTLSVDTSERGRLHLDERGTLERSVSQFSGLWERGLRRAICP